MNWIYNPDLNCYRKPNYTMEDNERNQSLQSVSPLGIIKISTTRMNKHPILNKSQTKYVFVIGTIDIHE